MPIGHSHTKHGLSAPPLSTLGQEARGESDGLHPDVNWEAVRKDFPVLSQQVYGKPLAYLDNAATTQKPNAVIEAIDHFYRRDNANVHRGVYLLSERATQAYEQTRDKVQHFFNAAHREEIIFVRGATEAINLVAQSFARPLLKPGHEILISAMEHHSNIVP